MGGPWFTVLESGRDWKVLDRVWLSDGRTDEVATVEFRVELARESETD